MALGARCEVRGARCEVVVPRLYVIADRDAFRSDAAWLDAIGELCAIIDTREMVRLQVRDKRESPAYAAAFSLAPRAFANGPSEVAIAHGFAAAHWPEASIAPAPAGLECAASAHSSQAVRAAAEAGAGFAVFGPVFAPSTKPVGGVGLDALAAVTREAELPILAIGGVTPGRVSACLDAGAHGIAVVSGVCAAPDFRQAIDDYLGGLEAP